MMTTKMNNLAVERINGGEPILSPTANWWESGVTFNAAAIYLEPTPGNEPVVRALLPMLAPDDPALARGVVAVHYRARPEIDPGSAFTRSFIGLALFTPDLRLLYRYQEPVLWPSTDPQGFDALGVEDPRITRLDGRFYMVYCGVQPDAEKVYRAVLCLAVSDDLLHWEKLGPLPGEVNTSNNKDGVLFPERIAGKYYLLHRPYWEGVPASEYAIRLAESANSLRSMARFRGSAAIIPEPCDAHLLGRGRVSTRLPWERAVSRNLSYWELGRCGKA